ncbi:hypothetical protein [Rhizobium sp. NFACC06-2]|uniref:hypothetical protein n=1 Tax=Rhizobium sp. NFACC06-2 TaxID=1566264 RepID=UPI00122CF70E|nr:hypothetical protein [Rhizobium sp. NFACC06-2]
MTSLPQAPASKRRRGDLEDTSTEDEECEPPCLRPGRCGVDGQATCSQCDLFGFDPISDKEATDSSSSSSSSLPPKRKKLKTIGPQVGDSSDDQVERIRNAVEAIGKKKNGYTAVLQNLTREQCKIMRRFGVRMSPWGDIAFQCDIGLVDRVLDAGIPVTLVPIR